MRKQLAHSSYSSSRSPGSSVAVRARAHRSMDTSTSTYEFVRVRVRALCLSVWYAAQKDTIGEHVSFSMCETSTTAAQSNNPPTASNSPPQPTHGMEWANTLAPGGLICCVLLLYVVPVRALLWFWRHDFVLLFFGSSCWVYNFHHKKYPLVVNQRFFGFENTSDCMNERVWILRKSIQLEKQVLWWAGDMCRKHRFLCLGSDRKLHKSADGITLGFLHDEGKSCFVSQFRLP